MQRKRFFANVEGNGKGERLLVVVVVGRAQ